MFLNMSSIMLKNYAIPINTNRVKNVHYSVKTPPKRHNLVISSSNDKLLIDFNRESPIIQPSNKGGFVEYHRGNYMVYDDRSMLIGNIKTKRYKYLQDRFVKFYNITLDNTTLDKMIESNNHMSKLWYNDVVSLLDRYKYRNNEIDIYNHASLNPKIIAALCDCFKLNNLCNYSPFNTPTSSMNNIFGFDTMFNKNNVELSSNNELKHSDNELDVIFGAKDLFYSNQTLTKTCFINSHIHQVIYQKSSSLLDTKPRRHLVIFPLLKQTSVHDYLHNFPCHKVICVIPKESIYMKASDHWYDIENSNLLNKHPLVICLFYNEMSLLLNPVDKTKLEYLENTINSEIIHNNNDNNKHIKNICIKVKKPCWSKKHKIWFNDCINSLTQCSNEEGMHVSIPTESSSIINQEIIYTDASIRTFKGIRLSSIGVWFGPSDKRNISRRLNLNHNNDINFCELIAIYTALLHTTKHIDVVIYTDSYNALQLIEYGYESKDQIFNKKYQEIVCKIVTCIKNRKGKTILKKIKAHVGEIGNENADTLARLAIYNDNQKPPIQQLSQLKQLKKNKLFNLF